MPVCDGACEHAIEGCSHDGELEVDIDLEGDGGRECIHVEHVDGLCDGVLDDHAPGIAVDQPGRRFRLQVGDQQGRLLVAEVGDCDLAHGARIAGKGDGALENTLTIEDIGIIPRYTGTLVHDCWASDFAYDQCRHQLCGSHLLRELTFVVESNGFRWARLMKKLLREACHRVNRSATKVLAEAQRKAVRKRYRTILTQGGKELPEIPPRQKGKRGRVAKSDAHNLHERLAKHEESVLRFMGDPDVSFTNNTGEQKIRMAKVKIKVSGCFRTRLYAEAWCRISSYLSSMAALGYNPLVAIQIALAGKAADMIKMHNPKPASREG